jgi:hypothetical protein
MSKIEKINLSKIINYSDDIIDFFIKENNETNLLNYDSIITDISNAKNSIQIASSSEINDVILDEIYKNKNINRYIILKSFKEQTITLNRFNDKNPAILREVRELNNNFIIIDNISYIFINPLDNKENLFLKLDEEKSKDLKYIFNYYFWDCATKEKLINEINEPPIESPYPPINKRELDYLNIDYDLENCIELFIPRDKKYLKDLDNTISEKKYISDDIKNIIYKNNEYIKIGNFKIKDDLEIKNRWILKKDSLKNIDTSINIIPKQENWNKEIKIKEYEEAKLPTMQAKTIEEMTNTKPNEFKQKLYIKKIKFMWDVLPPFKDKDAKKSKLYDEYEKLSNEYKNRLLKLKNILNELDKESVVTSFFREINSKAKQDLKKIEEYLNKDLTKLSSTELDEFLNMEFKEFYKDIFQSNSNFKYEKKKKDAEGRWKKEKVEKSKNLENKKKELKESEYKLETLKESDGDKKTKLVKSIKNIENSISLLEKDIKEKYTDFEYKEKDNSTLPSFNKFRIPKYRLPEVGTLYENSNSYFLEIEDDDELDKANKLKKIYKDKTYKVVAKED